MEQSLDGAQLESSGPRAGALSPLEEFILDEVEPRRNGLNTFSSFMDHAKLLVGAAKGLKLEVQKIGWERERAIRSRSGTLLGGFQNTITTLVSDQALRATRSRELTRQCLLLSDIPQTSARTFHISQSKSAAAFLSRAGQPVSIKPTPGAAPGGAAANLTTDEQLLSAWERAAAASSTLPDSKRQIEVEVFLLWPLIRLYVVGEEAVAAVARVPLYVIGDGLQSAHQLAEQELNRRNSCVHLDPVEETALGLLKNLPLDPDTVLEEGGLQLLTYTRDGQCGAGWSIDVTDRISTELAGLAINATWAFPGLGASAVDVLAPSLRSGDEAVVSQLIPGADLREFRYPTFGNPRFPNVAIIKRLSVTRYGS